MQPSDWMIVEAERENKLLEQERDNETRRANHYASVVGQLETTLKAERESKNAAMLELKETSIAMNRAYSERDAARAEAAVLRQRVAQGPEVITAKIQTAFTGCGECKVAAEAAALRAKVETANQALKLTGIIVNSRGDTIEELKREAAALRAEVEALRKENEILKAFKKTIARFEREADEKKYGALESEPIQAVSAGRERVQGCTCGTTPCVCPF